MLPLLRSVALAIVCLVFLGGCAARKQFASAPMRPAALTSRTVEPSAAAEATNRVKDAIQSLGRQLKRRTAKSPKALANLEPIPLISLSDRERAVGTSGIWSVVETTRATADKKEPYAQTQTRSGESGGRRSATTSIRWTLIIAGAAVLLAVIVLARPKASKRLEHL